MSLRWLVMVLVLPLLGACSMYHPLRDGVGFTEIPIGADTYEVTYVGDSSQSGAEARRYCLVRAAELAVLRGDAYFQIQDERIYLSYGTQYWPADSTYIETVPDRRGRLRAVWYQGYYPWYTEVYVYPEVRMHIRIAAQPGAATIPAAYLLHEALRNGVKLSPGVVDRMSTLPAPTVPFTIPPPPQPTTKPAPAALAPGG